MSIYDDLAADVPAILKKFGQGGIKLIGLTSAAGAADEPGTPTETETSLDATARGVSYTYIRSGAALASDLMVTSAPVAGVTPKMSDFIEIDSVRYKIVQIVHLPAAGTKLVWKFIVRKGG